jgi:hypothetical protein
MPRTARAKKCTPRSHPAQPSGFPRGDATKSAKGTAWNDGRRGRRAIESADGA